MSEIVGRLIVDRRWLIVAMGLGLVGTWACQSRPPSAVADPVVGDGSREETPLKEVRATFTTVKGSRCVFNLEVADTPDLRNRGLMHRKELPADHGMVFIFPREEDQTFFMKNTHIPLDMIFVNSGFMVVGVVENARPLTLETRSVGRLSRYVVELKAHTASARGIGPGARVEFDPPLKNVDR